ncbi:MAG: SH3 domain-containing protein [Phenylobacterium sp.]|nr:SH3 domain-containing protein [Phenylobacterium sp.]
MNVLKRSARLFAACLAGMILAAPTLAQEPKPRATPSGYAVPRYVTLKFGEVNARAGPGDDHRLLWVYRAKGLPVQVVAETTEWRRVCDPEGGVAWVHRRVTDGRRAVVNLETRPFPMVKRPKPDSETTAFLRGRGLASLDRCEKGWCKLKADRSTGWVRQGTLWGTGDDLQCR